MTEPKGILEHCMQPWCTQHPDGHNHPRWPYFLKISVVVKPSLRWISWKSSERSQIKAMLQAATLAAAVHLWKCPQNVVRYNPPLPPVTALNQDYAHLPINSIIGGHCRRRPRKTVVHFTANCLLALSTHHLLPINSNYFLQFDVVIT